MNYYLRELSSPSNFLAANSGFHFLVPSVDSMMFLVRGPVMEHLVLSTLVQSVRSIPSQNLSGVTFASGYRTMEHDTLVLHSIPYLSKNST